MIIRLALCMLFGLALSFWLNGESIISAVKRIWSEIADIWGK